MLDLQEQVEASVKTESTPTTSELISRLHEYNMKHGPPVPDRDPSSRAKHVLTIVPLKDPYLGHAAILTLYLQSLSKKREKRLV